MAEKKFESEDPMELVGTLMEADDEAIREMGLTFIEELARMRWPREDIEAVFSDPFYRGPHNVYRIKGPAFVSSLIDSVMGAKLQAQQPETAGHHRRDHVDADSAIHETRYDSKETGLIQILKRG